MENRICTVCGREFEKYGDEMEYKIITEKFGCKCLYCLRKELREMVIEYREVLENYDRTMMYVRQIESYSFNKKCLENELKRFDERVLTDYVEETSENEEN